MLSKFLVRTLNTMCKKRDYIVFAIEKLKKTPSKIAKGQSISKCPFGVFKSTKKPMKFL